jgi:hypothetical protein
MNAAPPASSGHRRGWLAAGVALLLFKLWLVSAQTVSAAGTAGHDDRLYLLLAQSLLRGEWLGPYSQFTLMKGPMYSLWIAGSFLANVPLFTSQHLLYAAMCALLTVALKPLVPGRGLRFLIFTVLLFNPMTYEAAVHGRVIRQGIYHSFALGALAGIIALCARRGWPLRRLIGWALLAGTSLAAFWLTREEGVWLLPLLGPLWLWLLVQVWRDGARDLLRRGLFFLTPLACWAAALAVICGLNHRYYGVFATVEFKAQPFMDAYGALSRVQPQVWRPWIVVQREVRERIYSVSPAFAELRPQLEGALGEGWSVPGEGLLGIPRQEREIPGGWFMWALRDAVAGAGHATTGAEAMAFYQKIADEVNAACDDGRLAAGPRRSGFLPVWNSAYWPPLRKSFARASAFFLTLEGFTAQSAPSSGPPGNLIVFSDLTRERLSPMPDAPRPPPQQRWLDRVRVPVLAALGHAYEVLIVPFAALAGLAWVVATGLEIKRRRVSFWLVLNAGIVVAIGAMTAINALIDATAFPSIATGAFTACYPLYFLFLVTAWLQLCSLFRLGKGLHDGLRSDF